MSNPKLPPEPSSGNYFQIRTFDKVVADGLNTKPRRKIAGAFLYEDSTTYLFSRTNYGKSLLVFQFAYAAATGTSIAAGSALKNECGPMKVLVVDLELDARDLAERHGKVLNKMNPKHYKNLNYLHEKMSEAVVVGFELLDKIERAAVDHKARLVIIDNISKLLPDSLNAETVTMVISTLNRIRKKTGATILVIGHTTKGNMKIAIQPTDYYGSAMLQNFFSELSFLDATKDGSYFLCHSKTKHKECYTHTVPVFTRGNHSEIGIGFSFVSLQPLADIQLPPGKISSNALRKRSLSQFRKEVFILDNAGIKRTTIAAMCNVDRSTVFRLFDS
ncbi:MAG TPA: AAA family ATPase [Prolixibacteraceae bacterium]|jgi:hypothetical protein